MVNEHLYKDRRLNLVFIAGGEININAMFGGALRRYIAEYADKNGVNLYGLAVDISLKTGIEEGEARKVIDAIQGERLREVSAGNVKKIWNSLGLENKICLPLVAGSIGLSDEEVERIEKFRDLLKQEMIEQRYTGFSDEAFRKYMLGRILEGVCGR